MRALAAGAMGAALALAAAIWLLRRRMAVVTITGTSMAPTYASGDRVLVRRARLSDLRHGQVVVVERPELGGGWTTRPPHGTAGAREWIIKRVVALPGDPWPPPSAAPSPFAGLRALAATAPPPGGPVPELSFAVQGDNPSGSFDSRIFGYCPADRLLGVVVRPLGARPG